MDGSSRFRFAGTRGWWLIALLAMMAGAQPLPETTIRPETTESLLASELARLAGRILNEASPGETDAALEAAGLLLQEAIRLTPEDAGLHHRLARAAELRGDTTLALTTRRTLLRLDPNHAATQWAVIDAGIARVQQVESRLARLETLIGPRGTSLRLGVRSRLAYTAALLHQEVGNAPQYRSRLKLATEFDPTNRDAAGLLALEIDLAASAPDLVARALGRVILTSPLASTSGVRDLAALLMEWGVFEPAAGLYECDLLVCDRNNRPADPEAVRNLALALAASSHATQALNRLDAAFEQEASHWSEDERIHVLSTRAEIARGIDDDARAREALADLFEALEIRGRSQPVDPETSPSVIPPADLEHLWLSLWFGREIEDASNITALQDHREIPADLRARLTGWWQFRTGRLEDAVATLTPWSEFDPAATAGLALIEQERHQPREAARWLAQIIEMTPGTTLGIWARREYVRLSGRGVPVSKQARRLETAVGKIPETLRTVISNPQQGIHLSARPGRISGLPLEAVDLTVRIRNDSPWALAIAPDSILADRVALVPAVFVAGRRIDAGMAPITIRIDERLFLEPGEWLDITVNVRNSEVGHLLDMFTTARVTLRFQIILGFVTDPETGRVSPGPWGIAREIDPIDIYPFPGTVTASKAVIQGLTGTSEKKKFQSLAVLGSSLAIGGGDHPGLALEVLGGRWAEMSDNARAYALCRLPSANATSIEKNAVDRFEGIAARSPGRLGSMVWLCTRSKSPTDPILADAMRSDDETLRAFAEALAQALPALAPTSP